MSAGGGWEDWGQPAERTLPPPRCRSRAGRTTPLRKRRRVKSVQPEGQGAGHSYTGPEKQPETGPCERRQARTPPCLQGGGVLGGQVEKESVLGETRTGVKCLWEPWVPEAPRGLSVLCEGEPPLCSMSRTPLTHFPWWNISGVGQPGWLQARRRETERAKERRGEAKGPGWEGTWRGWGQRELVQRWGPTVLPDHLASTIVQLMVPPDGLGVFPEGLLSPTQRRKNQPISICLPLLALEISLQGSLFSALFVSFVFREDGVRPPRSASARSRGGTV